jgi:DNA-binding Lrp family transcriptional regulator
MATSHFEVDSLSRNLATTFRTTIIDSQTAFVIDSRYANRGYLSPSTERSCIEQPTPLGVAKELLPVDRRIVELLLQQARLPITTLAEKVRESRPMIKYRLRRLEELGFLEGHTVELQLERIGMVKLVIQLETYSDDPALISELTSWCLKNPFVTRLTTQTGQYAIELEIEAPSLQSSSQIIDACCAEVPGLIRRANALLVDRTVSLWRAEGLEAPSGMMLSTAA